MKPIFRPSNRVVHTLDYLYLISNFKDNSDIRVHIYNNNNNKNV